MEGSRILSGVGGGSLMLECLFDEVLKVADSEKRFSVCIRCGTLPRNYFFLGIQLKYCERTLIRESIKFGLGGCHGASVWPLGQCECFS